MYTKLHALYKNTVKYNHPRSQGFLPIKKAKKPRNEGKIQKTVKEM